MNSMIRLGRSTLPFLIAFLVLCPRPAVPATDSEKREAESAIAMAAKLREQGKPAEAREYYLKFVSLLPEDRRSAWALVAAGDIDVEAGRPKDAIDSYAKAEKGYPGTPEAKLAAAKLKTAAKGVMEASLKKVEGPGENREKMTALVEAAQACEKSGDLATAVLMYQEAKRYALTREDLKDLSKNSTAVLVKAEKGLESGPPVPDEEKWLAMANLCEAAGEWDRAAGYYLKLAGIAKEQAARMRYSLRAGSAFQSAGKPAEAAARCSEVISKGPRPELLADAYRCAGMAYESMNDYREALTVYESYLEKVAAPAERGWALMRSAWCEEMSGNSVAAAEFYNDILTSIPRSYMAPEALVGLGMLHESHKEFREARAAYSRILDEYAGSHKEAEAKRRLEDLAVKEREWEKVREKLSGLSEQYPKRERGEGL